MSLNWIKNAERFTFRSLLLMDEFMIRVICMYHDVEFKKHLGILLNQHPDVLWYVNNKCPECADHFNHLVQATTGNNSLDFKRSESFVIRSLESLVVYVYPEFMDQLTYITGWDCERLLSITDFKDKKVLDLGSGTGRLAFAVTPIAKCVYACEPAERLRVYLKEKQKRMNVKNMYVLDGTIESIPFEDDSFDIVMAGHVIGNDYEAEYKELCRVLKSGGYIIDCPGEDERKKAGPSQEMIALGFQYSHYASKYGGDVYRYWKQVVK